MAEAQPPTVVEGATTGDVDDEIPVAKSAEDRKAAAALSSLDARKEDEALSARDVDQEAVKKAMDRLTGAAAPNGAAPSKKEVERSALAVKKNVKVDPADVALLVRQLELSDVLAGLSWSDFIQRGMLTVLRLRWRSWRSRNSRRPIYSNSKTVMQARH